MSSDMRLVFVVVASKSTTSEDSESSEEVDKDKEMAMFLRRFMRFMNSNKGRKFQKKEGLRLESTKKKDLIICFKSKYLGHIKFDFTQWKKGSRKQKLKDNLATWNDEDSFNEED
ncbi:hypothetical protein PVK06_027315 [Gossypium arboreum]|uniref:Uncharacterized protein n=1 Tax=Gossypium arboreum TaxID=29729 RepID=A0ABR0P0F6_GOSAR|nr:hypothetical protein PVK06_027315 [Gossypium arboreum]